MLPRERVFAALRFAPPDRVPLEYHPSPAGCWEHGRALRELWTRFPGDFGDASEFPDTRPRPECLDACGRYSELRRDEWGVLWKHLIFGIAGHPVERPLDDWRGLAAFRPPAVPATAGPQFERERTRAAAHRERYFLKSGWISIFEVMHAVRRFEDVLMDIASDTPEIHRLADLITEHQLAVIRHLLARGVDAIQFGDDFGTGASLMLSPASWRRFFRPRYETLMRPIREAGKQILFHTCGFGRPLLDDLAEMGANAIWPQLNSYPEGVLERFCRESRVAIALHPDRGELMTRSVPGQVCSAVERLHDRFAAAGGGAWFYVEIDAGFPFANVRALVESIARLRGEL